MDLIIQIDLASDRPGSRYACGIVVTDAYTARTIHEGGYRIEDVGSVLAADFASLTKALDIALPLSPTSLEIRCVSQALAEHLTGGAVPTDEQVVTLYEAALQRLLQLDSWRVIRIDREPHATSVQLASSALQGDGDVIALDPAAAEQQQRRAHTGVPQWTIELLDAPADRCPARSVAHRRFPFGPDVPAGLCVHAARVALNDGPLLWSDPKQSNMTTMCPHCAVPIRIECVDG